MSENGSIKPGDPVTDQTIVQLLEQIARRDDRLAWLQTEHERLLKAVEQKEAQVNEISRQLAEREHLPATDKGEAQVFVPTPRGYTEEASHRTKIVRGQWAHLSYAADPAGSSASVPLRLDPYDAAAIIDISAMTLNAEPDGSMIWQASSSALFDSLKVEGTAIRLLHPRFLRIFSYGSDPQIYFPKLEDSRMDGPIRLDIWMRVENDPQVFLQAVKEILGGKDASLPSDHPQFLELRKDIAGKEAQLSELQGDMAGKEAHLSELQRDIAGKEARLAELETELQQASASLSEQQQQRIALQLELDQSRSELAARGVEFEEKKKELGEVQARLAASLEQVQLQNRQVAATYCRENGLDFGALEFITLFDGSYYLQMYHDVTESGINPLWHYLKYGAFEGRNPHPLFDTSYYLKHHPDAAASGLNPLRHYWDLGAPLGYDPHPMFDTSFYLARYPDVVASGENPLRHFWEKGAALGYDPHPLFDTSYYLEQNPEVSTLGMNPLQHFLQRGAFENRRPFPDGLSDARSTEADTFHYAPPEPLDPYQAWLEVNQFNNRTLEALRTALDERKGRLPKVSVVMSVHNAQLPLLQRAIDSVLGQVYPDWELCIVDDASPQVKVTETLQEYASRDQRVLLKVSKINGGSSRATNRAVELATGEIIAFLDQMDELTPDALAEIAIYYTDHSEVDLLYSDDDTIDLDGYRTNPQFKPDWSPVLLLSYCYVGQLLTVRRALFNSLGGFRRSYEGWPDYDFVLRAGEHAKLVGHIPKVLYHRCALPESTPSTGENESPRIAAGEKAVAAALQRRGQPAQIQQPEWAKDSRAAVFSPRFPDDGPPVTIIIPTKDDIKSLVPCLESLKNTTYKNYRILLVDSGSKQPDTQSYLQSLEHQVIHIPKPEGRFCFAYLMNEAVRQVETEYLLFLEDGVEVRSPEWLSQMMGYIRMKGVGAVGPKLLSPGGWIQHAGVVHGYRDGMFGYAFKDSLSAEGYLYYPQVAREYFAVTSVCLLTPRDLFLDLGGFAAECFPTADSGIDYCYRLVDRGLHCIYCPVELTHREDTNRAQANDIEEESAFRSKYGRRVDPWYNPNLSLENEKFQVHPHREAIQRHRPVGALMFSPHLDHDCAADHLFELTAGLVHQRIIQSVVLSPLDGPLREDFEQAGIEVQVIGPARQNVEMESTFADYIGQIVELIQRKGAEVVYANTAQMFWAIAAARQAGLPSLWNIHENGPWQTYFDFLPEGSRPSAYRCFTYPYRVVFGNYAIRQEWAPLNTHHNFTVVRSSLDLERVAAKASSWTRGSAREKLQLADHDVVLILVGAVGEWQGQLDLVKAMESLSTDVADQVRCYIIGDRSSPYSATLQARLEQLPPGRRERVVVWGENQDTALFYQASDIAVCTSRTEVNLRVIQEAMAYGLPLITTPVFGIPELVRANVNGLFYSPGDGGALGSAISRLVTDGPMRKLLAAKARSALAALPDYEKMLAVFGALFQEACLSFGDPVAQTSMAER